jgi:hypothetical protein
MTLLLYKNRNSLEGNKVFHTCYNEEVWLLKNSFQWDRALIFFLNLSSFLKRLVFLERSWDEKTKNKGYNGV